MPRSSALGRNGEGSHFVGRLRLPPQCDNGFDKRLHRVETTAMKDYTSLIGHYYSCSALRPEQGGRSPIQVVVTPIDAHRRRCLVPQYENVFEHRYASSSDTVVTPRRSRGASLFQDYSHAEARGIFFTSSVGCACLFSVTMASIKDYTSLKRLR